MAQLGMEVRGQPAGVSQFAPVTTLVSETELGCQAWQRACTGCAISLAQRCDFVQLSGTEWVPGYQFGLWEGSSANPRGLMGDEVNSEAWGNNEFQPYPHNWVCSVGNKEICVTLDTDPTYLGVATHQLLQR